MPFKIALRDNPHARCRSVTPPWPTAFTSLAAIRRRVRSFKNGHTDGNFAVSSARLTTRPQDSTVDQKVVPLFMSGT
jgi:hypothetical protein